MAPPRPERHQHDDEAESSEHERVGEELAEGMSGIGQDVERRNTDQRKVLPATIPLTTGCLEDALDIREVFQPQENLESLLEGHHVCIL